MMAGRQIFMILMPSLGTVQGRPGLENRGEFSIIIGQGRNLSQKRNRGGLDKASAFQAESFLTNGAHMLLC